MIPILYEPTETAFTSNGLGRLADATACVVHEQRNGCFEMTIEMPTTGLHFSDIQKGSFIKATPSPTRSAQIFEVVNITKTMDGMMAEIYCQHISYRLNRIPVKPFTGDNAHQALNRMISNSVEANPFTAYSDVTRSGTYRHTVPSSAKACLQGEAGSILQVYQGEYLFDNFQISLLANRGVDRGAEIRFGKNLLELVMEESLEGVITGIMPYWKGKSGETDVIMMLPEYVVYSSHASDFPNARTEVIDFSGEFDAQPTEEQLRSAVNSYIDRNNIGVPKVDWDVEFATLAQTTEYSGIALLERMDLCDIVTIIFQDFGISVKAKIVETWYEPLKDRYQKVHIGDQRFTLAQTIASTAAQIEQSEAKQTTIFTQALEQATALLNGDLTGSSMKTITDANGNPIGLIFMDTNDPATAVNCIQINANGIGFSNNGPGGPYTSAWVINNTLDMSKINVIHINASAIDAGTIDADNVNIINLIVDHLQSFGNNNTWQLDSQASYLDLRQLVNSVWKQRGALFINNADGGTLRVSKGDVDSSGNPLSGASYRTFVRPQEITVGLDRSGTVQGTLTAKNINADAIKKLLIASVINTVGSYWELDATGVRFFLITGKAWDSIEQTIVIPNDSIRAFGTTHTYAIGDSTSNVQFYLSEVSGKVRVTIKSVTNGPCYLVRCYGII